MRVHIMHLLIYSDQMGPVSVQFSRDYRTGRICVYLSEPLFICLLEGVSTSTLQFSRPRQCSEWPCCLRRNRQSIRVISRGTAMFCDDYLGYLLRLSEIFRDVGVRILRLDSCECASSILTFGSALQDLPVLCRNPKCDFEIG